MRFSLTALLLAGLAAAQTAIHRRPDSFWDHIVKGADVQNSHDGIHRRLDGELAQYNLRVRQNDPAKLGVDKVKQYSGYLDDNDKDKHLFYCKSHAWYGEDFLTDQGSLSLATTRHTTPLSFGSTVARAALP